MPEDHELLRDYAHARSESAFTELVRRHIDLVYSAALRESRGDSAMAEEITQEVFSELARKASNLCSHPALAGWLYTCVRLISANARRSNARRQRREQEAHSMNELLSADSTESSWRQVEPVLDDAMHELSESDRAAVVLRFFEDRSHKDVGLALGLSESAARKRVDRALETLRGLLAKRGITIGASGLVAIVSANAVQAAPVGLAVTISAAVGALAASTIAATATVTATKAIAMTTLQKTLVGATLAAAIGTGIYEARQASTLRTQVESLHQQQVPLTGQIEQLTRERNEAGRQLVAMRDENDRLNRNTSELLRLRGEVGLLRRQTQALEQESANRTKSGETPPLNKGFGSLGEYLPAEKLVNAGNSTPEALLQTFVWAIREGKLDALKKIGAPFGGQREPGDVVGELAKSEATIFIMMQNAFTNAAGFRLSSKPTADGQKYEVRLEADPLEGGRVDEFMKNFNMSFALERTPDGWKLGNPFEDSGSK